MSLARQVFEPLFVNCDPLAFDPEAGEEFVVEGLRLTLFVGRLFAPFGTGGGVAWAQKSDHSRRIVQP